MTSRARLLAALRREQPDRVPATIYEYSPFNDDWTQTEPSYAPLLELERQCGDSFVFVPVDFPAFFDPATVRVRLEPAAGARVLRITQIDTPRGPLQSTYRRDPGLMTWWQVEPFIKSDADLERVLSLPAPPCNLDTDRIRTLAARVGDAGVLCFNPGDALGRVVDLFNFEDFVMRSVRDRAPLDALLERATADLLRGIAAAGSVVSEAAFRLWGPEYSGAPLMNPRRFFEPFVVAPDRQLTDAIHATGNFSIIHCHGRLRALLTPLVEIGADALEPIETLPLASADVTLAEVKAALGEHMCLMGAVQATTLENGTPAQMETEVREAIHAAAAGGGFVLLPTAAPFMLPLTPRCLENATAFYAAAQRYGRYA